MENITRNGQRRPKTLGFLSDKKVSGYLKVIRKLLQRCCVFALNIFMVFLSLFVPKSSRIIVLGGWNGQRFADNSRYMFLYLNKYKKELKLKKVVWVTKKKVIRDELRSAGYTSYLVDSLGSIYYHLRSKLHFIDWGPRDINPFFSVRAKKINLWHGIMLKNISHHSESKFSTIRLRWPFIDTLTSPGFWNSFFLLVPSSYMASNFKKAFLRNDKQIIIANYPRVDYLKEHDDFYLLKEEIDLQTKLKDLKKNNRLLCYLPTFRDNRKLLFMGTEDEGKIKEFLRFLVNNNLILVTKMHFAEKMFGRIEVDNGNHIGIADLQNIIYVPSYIDVYPFLKLCDLLITDYSSVYYDFLALDKPLIFYPYDYEYYRTNDRGFFQEYEKVTPGDKAFDLSQLQNLVIENLNLPSKYHHSREDLLHKSYDFTRSPGFRHIIDFFKND